MSKKDIGIIYYIVLACLLNMVQMPFIAVASLVMLGLIIMANYGKEEIL